MMFVSTYVLREWLKTAAILAVAGFLCWVLWDAHLMLRETRNTIKLADPVLGNVNSAAEAGAAAVAKLNALADVESGKIAASTEELRKTERATRASIDSLRQVFLDIHQVVIPQVTTDLHQLLLNANSAVAQLQPVIATLGKDADALAVTLNDPNIPKTIANLRDTTADLDADTKQLKVLLESGTATAEDVRQVADQVRAQYLKARNLYYAVASFLLQKAWEVRGAFGILK
jgi:hypothetical protein